MVVGAALLPKIDVADNPRPRQGKTLTVEFYWQRASAKVIEQNVTSRIEGLISAVKGMIPDTTIGRKALTRLHAYQGSEHKHQAQQPIVLE